MLFFLVFEPLEAQFILYILSHRYLWPRIFRPDHRSGSILTTQTLPTGGIGPSSVKRYLTLSIKIVVGLLRNKHLFPPNIFIQWHHTCGVHDTILLLEVRSKQLNNETLSTYSRRLNPTKATANYWTDVQNSIFGFSQPHQTCSLKLCVTRNLLTSQIFKQICIWKLL